MSIRNSANYLWSVTDLIGQGATGNVFMCRNKMDGKPYAAKVFNAMGQMRARDVRLREIELLRKLCHENVVILVAEEYELSSRATVLIMELCETSLYNILELPENYFGLSEVEFKCVLKDVVRGMRYLRENNVVHRDVKPGNILKTRSSTGSSVYKLTDFGAARQLKDAQQSFISIYGTEEYLHPDVYEKAVMKNFSRKKFTAAVDLWSMGVTFYHAATGQLPFRPYGGRQNKETMFEIISQKGPKIISGLQKLNGGQIEYNDDLPEETRISKGLKTLLRPILQELMETSGEGLEKLITFDQLYKQVEDIMAMKVIDVFCTNNSTWHKIYVKEENSLKNLQSLIALQTGVNAESQQMFLSSEELTASTYKSVNTLPAINKENPVMVVGGGAVQSSQLPQRRIPNVPKMPDSKTRPEDDIDVLKIYASICFVFMFCAEDFYFCLKATKLVADTMANILNGMFENVHGHVKKVKELKSFLAHSSFQSNQELNQLRGILETIGLNGSHDDVDYNKPSESEINTRLIQELQTLLEDANAICSSHNVAIFQHPMVEDARKWLDEIRVLSNDVNDIFMQIPKEKCMGHGTLDDLIYSSKKQKVLQNLKTIRAIFESMSKARQDCHSSFSAWLTNTSQHFRDLTAIQASLESADTHLMTAHTKGMDMISVQKVKLLGDLHGVVRNEISARGARDDKIQPSSASLNIMESEVSTLEGILQDIVYLVEEGDRKLMSSKEIFQELTNRDS